MSEVSETQTAIDAEWRVMPPRMYVDGEQDPPARRGEEALAVPETALVPVHEPSIEEILRAFQQWMRLDVGDGAASEATLRGYYADVRQHLGWLFGEGITPAQAGEEVLKGYRAFLLEVGTPLALEPGNPQAPEQYATSTVGRKLASIRRFYQMAQARGFMAHNPAEGLKAPRDRTDRSERVKYLTLVGVQRLLQQPNMSTPKGMRDRAMLVLMAIHGLRVAEIHNLNLDCLDLEAGEDGTLRVLGKGSKWRTVYLTFETREELRRWLAVRRMMRESPSEAIFLSLHWSNGRAPHGRLSVRAIRQMVDVYLVRTGAKRAGVSCHSLRHSYATHSLAAGAKLPAISKSMGHASIETTMVYADIVDRARENPAKFLTGLLE